ncbi:MAG: ABC transporter permease [Bacteroidia bacterium]
MSQRIIIDSNNENRRYFKDIWEFKGLFYFLAWRDVRVRYKQTTIGVAWAVLRPLLTILVLSLVRVIFSKGEAPKIPYPLMIAAGTLPWQFFSSAFSDASNSLVSNANLVSKVYFPRLIVPASAVIVCLIDFAVSFVIVLGIMAYYQFMPGVQILFLPLFLMLAIITALGTGLYIAALNVKYRDFRYVIPFIVQFGMYISPVMMTSHEFYAHPSIPEWAKTIYALNPMVCVIDGFRWCMFGEQVPIDTMKFFVSFGVSLVMLILGIYTFRKMEKDFADVI